MITKRKDMNKYEKRVMAGLDRIVAMWFVLVLLNFAIPIRVSGAEYKSIFSYIIIGIHLYGVLQACGFGNQTTPLAQILLCRIVELFCYIVIFHTTIRWVMFGVVLFADAVMIALEMYDRHQYEYVRERVEN